MAIRVACTCGQIVEAAEEQRGQQIPCPACGTMLTVQSSYFTGPVVLDYAPQSSQSHGFRMRRADWITVAIVIAVVFTAGLATCIPMLTRVRKGALQASCGSNLRQLTYGALAYANDWKDELPTAVGIPDHRRAYPTYRGRLPVMGFDTCTQWDWQTYQSIDGMNMLGGWAFMMRDYLKNDFDVVVCTDGYVTRNDVLIPWDGSATGKYDCALYDHTASVGYLWLPHRRPSPSVTIGNCCNDGGPGAPATDKSADIARKSTDKPDLFVTTDWNQFESRSEAGCTVPANTGCGVLANHNPKGAKEIATLPWASGCMLQVFPPGIGKREDPLRMPLGMNRARIDARTTWNPWQDWDNFKWGQTFDPKNGRWHSW